MFFVTERSHGFFRQFSLTDETQVPFLSTTCDDREQAGVMLANVVSVVLVR